MSTPIQFTPLAVAAQEGSTVKIELDERAFLFPEGKPVTHMVIVCQGMSAFHLDAVFAFNRSRDNARFATLTLPQMREFTRELLGAVYAAKPTFVLDGGLKLTITVVLNGYICEFVTGDDKRELFLGTGCIWRVIKSLMAVVDEATAQSAG
ncbi:MAG: hypothetical protein ACRCWO_00265 [Bosea sp. (in: a-proteobacteria)]